MSEITGRNVGKTCRTHYRGTFNDGTQFDSSYDRGEPLEFVCGAGQMIKGFDAAVADMEVGEVKEIHLMPEENQKDATTAEADASKKDAKAEQKTVKYIRQERYSGNVSRSFYVGENLEEKDIHAKFENGTLTLTFPKELEKKAVEEKHFVSIEG